MGLPETKLFEHGSFSKDIHALGMAKKLPYSFQHGVLVDDLWETFSQENRVTHPGKLLENLTDKDIKAEREYAKRYISPDHMDNLLKEKKAFVSREGVFIRDIEGMARVEKALKRTGTIQGIKRTFSRAGLKRLPGRFASGATAAAVLAISIAPAVESGVRSLAHLVDRLHDTGRQSFGAGQVNIPMEAYNERSHALQVIAQARMQAQYPFGNEADRYSA